jgi:hypothetical protein
MEILLDSKFAVGRSTRSALACLMTLEVLHCLFMLGGGAPPGEGPQVPALAAPRILLA